MEHNTIKKTYFSNINVKEITFTSYGGRSQEELAGILEGELGITATIREVGS